MLLFYYIQLGQSWFGLIRPVKNSLPAVWSFLKGLNRIIGTTRNGLFFGFLFVGIGMLFAFEKISISKVKSFWLFIFSFIILGGEAYIVKVLELDREQNMYLFLVPTTIFGFSYIKQISLKDRPMFELLRKMSSLIFYTHLWISAIVGNILEYISEPLAYTGIKFIATLLVTVCASIIILELAKKPKFRWLNMLWN